MREIEEYVERAFYSIPNSARKSETMQEIIQRLTDSAEKLMGTEKGREGLMGNGRSREDAINKAIVDFGDLGEIIQGLREDGARSGKSPAYSALWFSIIGSLAIVALVAFINLYYTPRIIWFLYPAFGVAWWPLSVFFFGKWRRMK
ncbi:MAG: hypothetical protein LBU32_19485 [Clostridiales bacterium]|jgi:hypothetical protein|nr:hypothetical protein [Clostridiales bacterium]